MTDGADPDQVQRLLDEERADQRAAQRTRERWLRQQAGEESRLVDVLAELVATRSPVTLHTLAGRSHHGRIAAVGRDFCSLLSAGLALHVRLAALATVRPAPEAAIPEPSARTVPHHGERSFAELVGRLAEERPRVNVALIAGGETLAGTLTAAGIDVLTLALDGPGARSCYVRLESVAELSVRLSG